MAPHRLASHCLILAMAIAATAQPAAGQFRDGHPPQDLATYDWTAWLVGRWEGVWDSSAGKLPYVQTFELSPDHEYLITHNVRGAPESAYRGLGVFSYYPLTREAYGQWFGMNHDTNDGWAVRDGERMIWTVRRHGLRITRVRTRTGPDSFTVENEALAPDGSVSHSTETMRRVSSPGFATRRSPTLDEARAVALAMPHTIDYADWEGFIGLFSEEAMMYFPFSPQPADGREAIAAVMQPIFERNQARLPGPIFGLQPADIRVVPLGSEGAVVSWRMDRGGQRQRRTVVLREEQGTWKVALVHADNWALGVELDDE